MKIIFDYSLLQTHIDMKYGGLKKFAKEIGVSLEHAFNLMNHVENWTMEEMNKACDVLRISHEFIPVIFFTPVA